MAEALRVSSESHNSEQESNASSDDWDQRSRSSSSDSFHNNIIFTERQISCDSESSSLDLSYLNLDVNTCDANISQFPKTLLTINLSGNRLTDFPKQLMTYSQLQMLDLSQNQLTSISSQICELKMLRTLICANNQLDDNSLPKDFGSNLANNLRVLSLSGNLFQKIPQQILELKSLKSLYLGSNAIEEVPRDIYQMESLRLLYLGGNQLESLPEEVGRLKHLESLSLCENKLRSLPTTIVQLKSLRSLALHRNQLTTLPEQIVKLRSLIELSLRNNPLVMRFVKDMMYETPSLMELSARAIKINKIHYNDNDLPNCLSTYLNSAHRCVNPKCKGVYFDSRVEHIKFVDFCGSYRLPLLQYLCSPRCSSQSPAVNTNYSSDDEDYETEEQNNELKMKRVLLG